ncbi:MAG TPA: hypothetical protein VEM57_11290 [Candidatus Binatus sp.]|nr:hypothetical protein [Candidatus Binatus sp.]
MQNIHGASFDQRRLRMSGLRSALMASKIAPSASGTSTSRRPFRVLGANPALFAAVKQHFADG